MERATLNVEKRDKTGKGIARSLRRQGMIPAVIYRDGGSLPISISKKAMAEFIDATSGEHTVVNLNFSDGDKKLAILKEFQLDPLKGDILHTDFFEVSLTEKVTVNVRVMTLGEPIGVKRDGGILQHVLREVEIECLPDKIPGHFEIDISKLETGQAVHVKDISIGEGIKLLTEPDEVIVNVIAPAVEKEEAAPAEGVVATAPAMVEPEVVKKGKKEEKEEGAEKAEKKEKGAEKSEKKGKADKK
ncbi:MAG: 50S ribosomal protein L25 [Thermodesulfovibrionales bacterium]|nr:50S ribosomal protein L25 [Thermodesulfovibrionales bacterium]